MSTRPPVIAVTVDGQPAQTIDQAATAHGMGHDAMAKALRRAGAEPAGHLGRYPLYLATTVAETLAGRIGRGAPGVPRPHRPPVG